MKFDNKTFQQKYEAWKNGADYWKDIRGINLGGDTQAEEPSPEEQLQIDQNVQSILNAYNEGKDVNIAEDIIKPLPFDAPLNEEHPILHKYKGGKDDSINTFVNRMGPLVGQQLNRYGYGDAAFYNVMRQLAYESNYGRSRVARRQHNYGGVGWNGKTYNTYKSDADFVKDYVRLMHTRYGAALRAKSTQDYARALKQKGYYEDSLQNYSRNLNSMNSLVKAARNHKNAHKDAYNYNVQLNDIEQDYEDAKNASPIIINSPSIRQPSTIRADVPTTLLGPTQEEIKAQQQRDLNKYKQQMYDSITQPSLPNILNLLPSNNFGKDSYGQKFWLRRGNNLHFKGGKDERIAGVNPLQQEMFPNKQVRDLVYQDLAYNDEVSDYPFNDRLLNIIQLYKLSGSPSITNKSKSKYNIIRSNYIPYYNHINAYPGSLVSELSHAYQYNNSIRKPIMPLDNKGVNGSDYKRRGSIEHQAHEVIQPNLVNFIETGDKKYLKKAKIDANKEYDKHGHWWRNKGKD